MKSFYIELSYPLSLTNRNQSAHEVTQVAKTRLVFHANEIKAVRVEENALSVREVNCPLLVKGERRQRWSMRNCQVYRRLSQRDSFAFIVLIHSLTLDDEKL